MSDVNSSPCGGCCHLFPNNLYANSHKKFNPKETIMFFFNVYAFKSKFHVCENNTNISRIYLSLQAHNIKYKVLLALLALIINEEANDQKK